MDREERRKKKKGNLRVNKGTDRKKEIRKENFSRKKGKKKYRRC
jgi:hypothetical protein